MDDFSCIYMGIVNDAPHLDNRRFFNNRRF